MGVRCDSVEGGRQWLDGGALFGHAPKALWTRWVDCDAHNRVQLACRCLLVRTESLVVLVEAGIGAFLEPALADRYGVQDGDRLFPALAAKGVDAADVDVVILSHLHFDHAGGLVPPWPASARKDWEPRFPKARYVVSRAQWERSRAPHPRDRASFVPGLAEALERTGRLCLVDGPEPPLEALQGLVRFHLTEGHTPGMLHAIIHGPERTLCFTSDLVPGPAWLHVPITTGYDRHAERTSDEKADVLARAAAEDWLLFYTHDPHAAASGVRLAPDGRYEAVDPVPELNGLVL